MWPVWRMREVRYGPQHRATTRTTITVTLAGRVSSLYSNKALAWDSLVFMELLRVEMLVRSCWPVERMEGERERENGPEAGTVSKFFPYREVIEWRLMEEMEFLRVRTELPLAAVNILT